MKYVLFVCTHNAGRSQIAQAFFERHAPEDVRAESAGQAPADAVWPEVVEAMREVGIDIGAARPKGVAEFLGHLPVRHLIIVCHDAAGRCPSVWPGVISRTYWPIEDPAAFRGDAAAALDRFRQARDEISARLDEWLAERKAAARGVTAR